MINKTSTVFIAALISILGLTGCVRYNVAEPLNRFSSPEMGTADGNEITVTAGSTWFAEGEYENFILTGQARTEENAEAALLFHTDGTSGYEVAFRNGAIDGTRKSGSLTSVRNLYRSLAEDGKWFDFEKGFIRAEVIKYEDYISYGSESAVKEAGKMSVEGKEYIVQDGDIMHFRFNV